MNNYQKMNEQIRLSEEKKEEMVSEILAASKAPQKAKKGFQVRWVPAMVGAMALVLAVIHIPTSSMRTSMSTKRSADTGTAESTEENALVTSDYSLEDFQSTEYESLEALEEALGYTVELPEELPFEPVKAYYYETDGEAEIDYYSENDEVYIYFYSPED